ncbi:MAG: hypothetical protein B7733_13605 [Myxococcales bacterium FL481]|nr:MAG: hypothetical protein B7733_13605 [Myxococcales bacterium FL481]
MTHARCDVLARSAALVIAIAIDTSAAADSPSEPTTLTGDTAQSSGSETPGPRDLSRTDDPSQRTASPGSVAGREPSPVALRRSTVAAAGSSASGQPQAAATSADTNAAAEPPTMGSGATPLEPAASDVVDPSLDRALGHPELQHRASGAEAPNARVRDRHRRSHLAVLGGVGGGSLPTLGGGVALELATHWRRFGFAITPTIWLPREVPLRDTVPAVLVLILPTLGLDGCWHVGTHPRFTLPLCLGADAGVLIGRGEADEGREEFSGRTDNVPWASLRGVFRPWWWMNERMGLGLRAELAFPITRARVEVDGWGILRETSAVDARVYLGVGARFGLTRARSRGH